MPATDTEQLVVSLEARIRDFERNFEKANRTAQKQFAAIERRSDEAATRIERSLASASDRGNAQLQRLGKGLSAAGVALKASLVGFAAGVAGGISLDGVTKSIADLAEINDVAERTGASAKFIQEFGFAVRQSGGDAEDANKGLQKFAVNASKAAQGTGDLAKLFEANGVTLTDQTGKLRPLSDLLGDVAELIKNATSEQDRLNIASMAFGKSGGPALVLALADGKQGLADLAAQANRAGAVLGDKLVSEAAKLDDQLTELQDGLSGLGKQLAVEFAGPALSAALGEFLKNLREAKALIDAIKAGDIGKVFSGFKVEGGVLGFFRGDYNAAPGADADLAALEKRAQELRARIAEAAKLPENTPGAALLANYQKQLAEIEERIKRINAHPLDFTPSRAGYTAGGLPTETPGKPTVLPAAEGSDASNPLGSGDAIALYVRRVIAAESGGKADAKNPNSSATGAGQFIESTWLALFRKHYPEQARTMGESAILALRKDADVSKTLIEEYAKENAATLRAAGVSVNEAALHLSHFLGAGDAAKVLKAAPGTPLQGLISSKSIAANPSVLGGGRTTDDAIAYAERRANATRLAAGDRTDAEKTADKQAEAVTKIIAALTLEGAQLSRTEQQQRLYQELQAAGVDLNSKEGQAIAAKVQQLYELKSAQDASTRSAEQATKAREEFASIGADATKGFLSDLRNGTTAAQAFANALNRIADRLIDTAVDNLFKNAFAAPAGGAAGGGFFSWFGKMLGFADGGPVERVPGFATGGYVSGPGGPRSDSVLARLSDGEYVVNAEATKKHGPMLEAINSGRVPAFASGGMVGKGSGRGMARGGDVNFRGGDIKIEMQGSSGDARQDKEHRDQSAKAMRDAMHEEMAAFVMDQKRPGGMLAGT